MLIRLTKKMMISGILAILLACMLALPPVSACTIFAVTPGASDDGSMYVAHTNDGVGFDWRNYDDISLVYVPPADYAPGEMRPIAFDPNSGSDAAGNKADGSSEAILGYIEQVPHTYGYYTASYGMMNEHQLLSGECTDYAKIELSAEEGKRIFYSSELSNIALERCTTARGAIELVGELIETYGYYGTGETLIFADPKEAWVIEMCSSPEGTGGLWAAEKIPDGEVFVAGNEFRIRDIEPDNPDMLYATDLFRIAEDNTMWSPADGALDWLEATSYGEYSHPYYSLMRVWSIQDRLAPSFNLSPYVENSYTEAYPFTITPDEKINLTTAFSLYRDHYEGTEFDLTEGVAAGPFGNPYRYLGPDDAHTDFQNESFIEVRAGANPRPVSAVFCAYSYVAQARADLPDPVGGVLWFGPAVAYETVYAPIYAGAENVSVPYATGDREVYDPDAAYWTFDFVTNWAMLRYDAMIGDIQAKQSELESESIAAVRTTDTRAVELIQAGDEEGARQLLTNVTVTRGDEIIDEWHALTGMLVVKYSNGLITDPKTENIEESGYPAWWSQEADYQYGPRVYELDKLRETDGLNYTGQSIWVPKNASF
ncbi:dipeptidase [Methanogenium organophilum]|uniref:C69 family dipeptidase n=1 Tax=Methanogenium organophilum TaxID=2199 RepID=A0A9X9S4S2_METOG|nr:C69 family dipeptidase [Methanogenium organophilum]WAI01666.1 C69 family dipeptidase [Methanogenium organophilum]